MFNMNGWKIQCIDCNWIIGRSDVPSEIFLRSVYNDNNIIECYMRNYTTLDGQFGELITIKE